MRHDEVWRKSADGCLECVRVRGQDRAERFGGRAESEVVVHGVADFLVSVVGERLELPDELGEGFRILPGEADLVLAGVSHGMLPLIREFDFEVGDALLRETEVGACALEPFLERSMLLRDQVELALERRVPHERHQRGPGVNDHFCVRVEHR